ncbi:hypothetical protein C7293_03880 [filamentous cyanobacterium CCT1]|nr:hypothetical protein C7293_03880 [filamentous cyanobacterium CCT1]PSN80035.1 hypothetical protein C8B47_08660 [filamentous cyanobacterium CCP4]
MANKEHLAILRQGLEVWNEWRIEHSRIIPDLSDTNLAGVNLSEFDLEDVDFSKTCLRKANLSNTDLTIAMLHHADLSNADLSGANLESARLLDANLDHAKLSNSRLNNSSLFKVNLRGAELRNADFSNASLCQANLACANLLYACFHNADLSFATLRFANFYRANLSQADMSNADLSNAHFFQAELEGANLSDANLREADFRKANLSEVALCSARVLDADFTQATFTGACIADWQIGSSTILKGVKCDYIFRTYDYDKKRFSGRLPADSESAFALDEFTKRFRIIASALETIDITFTKGIDWQAFFQSFQDLRNSRPDEAISIQGMERKGDAFIMRLEVEAEADKAAIETELKQRYTHQLAALEAQYQERLRLQSDEIAYYRQTQSSLLHIVQTMAEKDSISQTFHGPVGNVAGTNQGQMTAYINQNNEAISQLIAALRASAHTFPTAQKDDVLMELDDLEGDLSKPEKQEPKRIGKRLQRLLAAGTAAATLAGGAATFAGDVNDFTANVLDLGEKIGLSRDAIQP